MNSFERRFIIKTLGLASFMGMLNSGCSKKDDSSGSAKSNGGSAGTATTQPGSETTDVPASFEGKRVLQIFLNGGLDAAITLDPPIGSKASSGGYEGVYNSKKVVEVSGKSNLKIGEGLVDAKEAFASTNTAFINGMFMEVTAHELAVRYMYSGRLSLGNSRQYPAFISLLGKGSGAFPAHTIIGSEIPLGDTAVDSPPLQASNVETLVSMLSGPKKHFIAPPDAKNQRLKDAASIGISDEIAKGLDDIYFKNKSDGTKTFLEPWQQSSEQIRSIYDKNYGDSMVLEQALLDKYGAADENSVGAKIAGGFLSLKSGLSQFTSINFGGFDTHDNHMGRHIPLLQEVFKGINALVKDLKATEDPVFKGKTLAETTTIVILSDFVRTPKFNARGGTDHWKSGSAIVMGAGVKDNIVLGATDDNGKAMGWEAGKAVEKTDSNILLPDHLSASILRYFDLTEEAEKITKETKLDELFV